MRRLLASVALLLLVTPAWALVDGSTVAGEDASVEAGAIEVTAHLEPNAVKLGQPFDLVVELHRAVGQQVQVPETLPDGPVQQVAPTRRKLRSVDGGFVEELRFTLAAFKLKDARTPAFSLTTSTGEPIEIVAMPVRVQGQLDQKSAEGGPADAIAPVELTRYDDRPLAAALGLFMLVGAGLFFAWLARRRPPVPLPAQPLVVEPPADAVALARLAALERSKLITQGELERFVDEAIDSVLRWYLGKRYAFAALDMTSVELSAQLRLIPDPNLDVAAVERLLREADLIKFAREPANAQLCGRFLQGIRAIVETTRPKGRGEVTP